MYPRPTLTALRAQAISDIQTANLTNDGSALLPQSILRTLAVTEAGLTYELYAYLDYIAQMAIPVTATGEYLETWANLKGVFRLPATSATGTIGFTGTFNTVVPAGSLVSTTTQTQYLTTADYTIGISSPVGITAVVPAAAGNAAPGITLTLANPIPGVNSATTAVSAITGGADQELDQFLRSRMLEIYAHPGDGGSANQINVSVLEVPGVTRSWVNTIGVTSGAVQIFIMLDQTESAFGGFGQGTPGGATDETRIAPATGDMLEVANHLFPLRPVTSLYYVATPTPVPVNFSIQALSPTTVANEAAIRAALTDMFVRLGSPLQGNAIYSSSSDAAIQSVASVNTFTLLSPITPITVPIGSLPVLGNVVFT